MIFRILVGLMTALTIAVLCIAFPIFADDPSEIPARIAEAEAEKAAAAAAVEKARIEAEVKKAVMNHKEKTLVIKSAAGNNDFIIRFGAFAFAGVIAFFFAVFLLQQKQISRMRVSTISPEELDKLVEQKTRQIGIQRRRGIEYYQEPFADRREMERRAV